MILSDRTIAEYIEQGKIEVEPSVEPEQVQPASLDVRLGDEMYNQNDDVLIESVGETIGFMPGVPYRVPTMDRIKLPDDIAALLTGRSSVGRQGVIIHKTAGWIDPGFEGTITLEVLNFSNELVNFNVGDRIGQLVFFKLDQPSQGYDGQYQGQEGIQL